MARIATITVVLHQVEESDPITFDTAELVTVVRVDGIVTKVGTVEILDVYDYVAADVVSDIADSIA